MPMTSPAGDPGRRSPTAPLNANGRIQRHPPIPSARGLAAWLLARRRVWAWHKVLVLAHDCVSLAERHQDRAFDHLCDVEEWLWPPR